MRAFHFRCVFFKPLCFAVILCLPRPPCFCTKKHAPSSASTFFPHAPPPPSLSLSRFTQHGEGFHWPSVFRCSCSSSSSHLWCRSVTKRTTWQSFQSASGVLVSQKESWRDLLFSILTGVTCCLDRFWAPPSAFVQSEDEPAR